MATKQEVIFTRVRGLASVVWDPEKNRMLAHFSKQGLLVTDDKRVIDRLDAMGYRRVTAAQVAGAGLTLPTVEDSTRTPGRGYTHDGEERPATAFPMGDVSEHTEGGSIFDPVDEEEYPPGPPGARGRSLVR